MERLDVPGIAAWLVVLILLSPAMITNLFEKSTAIYHPNVRLILWVCYAILWFIFITYLFAPNRIWTHIMNRKTDYFVLVGTVIFLLVLLEFGWQISKQLDDGPPEGNVTNVEYTYSVQMNSDGFRDETFSRGKSLTTRRVLLYGDEIVFGEGVDQSHKIDVLMEDILNARNDRNVYQVYAIGHPGDGPRDHLKYADRMPKISGDIVVLLFNVDNDILTGADSLEDAKDNLGTFLDSLHVPKLVTRDITGDICTTVKTDRYLLDEEYENLVCKGLIDTSLLLNPKFSDVQERYDAEFSLLNASDETKSTILSLRREGHANRFLLVLSPSKYQLGDEHFVAMRDAGLIRQNGTVSRDIQDNLIAWAEENEIPYIDLLPILEKESANPYYDISTNYNAEGNAAIAEILVPLVFP